MTLVLHTDDEEPQIKEEKKNHTYIPRYAWYILCTYINQSAKIKISNQIILKVRLQVLGTYLANQISLSLSFTPLSSVCNSVFTKKKHNLPQRNVAKFLPEIIEHSLNLTGLLIRTHLPPFHLPPHSSSHHSPPSFPSLPKAIPLLQHLLKSMFCQYAKLN